MTTPDPATEAAARPATPVVGWRALARALRPRATPAQALTGVLCVMLGFAIAVQVRQTDTASLSTMRESELVSLLDQTTRQADELQDQVSELERTQQELQSGSTSREAALDAATRSAAAQGILSGRLPAEGPGVTVTVRDPEAQVSALTLLNLLEELRNAGAEAVQLNDRRLTASSYVLGTDAGIEVDGSLLSPPYRWIAIGDPDTIATALAIPGGALAKVQIDGGQTAVQTQDLVQVTATRTVPEPEHATPRSPEQG
ncbi:DUF881 domain-containing protein [Cellulomonas sp. C5510]|uniref:DUF881 domain-containing protein n=1 Tax=Cellulomonas sp. C5510 TaxID=2871170 RepID=UPI001C944952|nr:DUF881 domain-containing protein [Cellulomonas sp. C5510]QZN84165.1 DUF881 domain-containing protein [Cellulomonas sp. C5510]